MNRRRATTRAPLASKAIVAISAFAFVAALGAGGTVAGHLVTERLDACNSFAMSGCHATYVVTATATANVPGAGITATAAVVDKAGKPAAGVNVTLSYPGQPVTSIKTDAHGRATATFTQQALPTSLTVRAYVPGPWLARQRLVGQGTITLTPTDAVAFPASVQSLLHRSGAYSIPTPDAAQTALDARYTLLQTASGNARITAAAAGSGGVVIDGRPASIVRSVLCDAGVCHKPSAAELDRIGSEVRAAALSPAGRSATTAAWEILAPDMSGQLRPALERVRQTLDNLGDNRPGLCAFQLPMARPGDTVGVVTIIKDFGVSAQNFDAQWCSLVGIANVGSTATSYYSAASYDWSLTSVLGPAMAQLRGAGWNPATQPLIGMPSAYGWTPRVDGGVRYRPVPRYGDLSDEIGAYGRVGASSFVTYAWDDGARMAGGKPAPELGSTPYLRDWTRRLINHFARLYWHTHLG